MKLNSSVLLVVEVELKKVDDQRYRHRNGKNMSIFSQIITK